MIAYYQVFQLPFHAGLRHLFYVVEAIAPVAMTVNDAFYIAWLDQLGAAVVFGIFDHLRLFTHGGRNERNAGGRENGFFRIITPRYPRNFNAQFSAGNNIT